MEPKVERDEYTYIAPRGRRLDYETSEPVVDQTLYPIFHDGETVEHAFEVVGIKEHG